MRIQAKYVCGVCGATIGASGVHRHMLRHQREGKVTVQQELSRNKGRRFSYSDPFTYELIKLTPVTKKGAKPDE